MSPFITRRSIHCMESDRLYADFMLHAERKVSIISFSNHHLYLLVPKVFKKAEMFTIFLSGNRKKTHSGKSVFSLLSFDCISY